MHRQSSFNLHHDHYDDWFTRHPMIYQSELLAVQALLPRQGLGLDIGVGTGRFAAPLGVQIGLDPARAMLSYAKKRGVSVVQGVAEALPFSDHRFDYTLSVTTLCFLDDPSRLLLEARRVLKTNGTLVLGFIDRHSNLGRQYVTRQADNIFYRGATLHSAIEIEQLLFDHGFTELIWRQTLSDTTADTHKIEPPHEGFGQGGFVVVKARPADTIMASVRL